MNPEEIERFKQLAEWWKVHGKESIRNTRGGPYLPGPWGVSTCKDNRIFLHIFRWPENGGLSFPALKGLKLKSARLLSAKKVETATTSEGFTVTVPKSDREKILTTVELTFDGKTRSIKPLPRIPSLTTQAELTVSQNQDQLKNLTDQNASTYWKATMKKEQKECWIEATFKKPVTISSFYIGRGDEWSPRLTAALQIPNENGGWKTITPKNLKLKWETIKFLKKPVTTDKVRLLITNAKKFICAEFELYPPVK